MTRWLSPALSTFLLVGCIAGHLPTVRTDQIVVSDIGVQGLSLEVRLIATNERHSETIHVDALRVHVTVADQDLGVVDVAESWDLPPNQPVSMASEITVPVANLPGLALTAASGPVPYHLEGRAHVQNIGWTVDFEYDGQIPQQQLMNAAGSALPFGLSFP